MSPTYHLAIDLGATSGRTILAAFDGTKVQTEEVSRFRNPMLNFAGHLFWNLPGLFDEIVESIGNVMARGINLSSIGIDTWGCDVAYFYKDGSIAGLPYCYRDQHTSGAVDRADEIMPRNVIYKKTGIQFMDFNTIFQLDTVRHNNPQLIANAEKILFIPDALAYMLTGNAVTERTIASTSQILDPRTGQLDTDILHAIGIDSEKFAPMVEPGATIGEYNGIPVIAVAGHDTASAVIAVPSPDKDFAYLSCGTWSLLGVESDSPIINDKTAEYNFTNEGGLGGSVRFLKNICGLWLLEQARKHLKDAPSDISKLSALCLESKCDSTINPDAPDFVNPDDMAKAIHDYCVSTHQEAPKSAADYTRIIFRSLSKRYKQVLGWLEDLAPVNIKRLHVIGGGCKNPYLMQMTADELGMPVVAGPTESTALGNVLVQLSATDGVKNLREIAINSTKTKTFYPK